MSTLPFLAVTADTDEATHLVVTSPALRSPRITAFFIGVDLT